MTAAQLADKAGVGESTLAAQFRKIRDALKLHRMAPEWTLPAMLAHNPFVWTLSVNSMLMDVRHAPREIQEEAFRAGLIPFIPADDSPGPESKAGGAEAKQGGEASQRRRTGGAPDSRRVYQLKITLEDVRPAIWRRVLVPEDTTLVGLHRVIQAAMGWEDYHLWHFEVGDVEYAEPSDEEWRPTKDARQTRLGKVAGPGSVVRYVYD